MIRTKAVIKYLGYILLFNALFLFISAAISWFLGENSMSALLFSAILATVIGLFPLIFIEKIEEISFHEGLIISVVGWAITCILGLIPYYMWGGEFSFSNALFESVSGFTTTGASILTDVEALPKGLLFWRSSTTFIGGFGIILFVLLIMPEKKGIQSIFYRSEVSDLSKMSFRTRSRQIIHMIALVYFSLIIIETVLLKILGMNFFDAICHSLSTIATAGFSTKNSSIAAYDNVWIEFVIMFFMLISSMHFGILYTSLSGKKFNIFTSRPSMMYMMITFIGILLVAWQLVQENMFNPGEALRYASFQVISFVSTTGFATTDTAHWPLFSVLLLIYFSMQCGMVGSTSGGIKFDRIYLFAASVKKQLKLIVHPEGIYAVKMDRKIVDQNLELQIAIFIVVYLATVMITALLLSTMGVDALTSITASIATLGNVGPGFGEVSSFGNYGLLPDIAKYILSMNMLLGRLEIMNVFALFLMWFKRD